MSLPWVLLPPSEGKASGGDGAPYDPVSGAFTELAPARRAVERALRSRDFDAAGQLKVTGRALQAAVAANRSLRGAGTLPALRRYTGVLYQALDYPGRTAQLRGRLDRQLLVVSGLLGLLRGDDPVPGYKVPIGAALPGLGRLATYWKPRLARPLAGLLAGQVVWDLLPAAHAAAVQLPPEARRWQVVVQREVGGRRRTVAHENKAVKGALAAALVAGGHTHPDQLDGWEGPGGYHVAEVQAGPRGGLVCLVAAG